MREICFKLLEVYLHQEQLTPETHCLHYKSAAAVPLIYCGETHLHLSRL